MLPADKIVEALRVPTGLAHESPVFALVPRAGPVSFHSQQKRAFNLVAALHHEKIVDPDTSVAVIGAGLAGITASAAARMIGCSVTLFEANQIAFHQQRGNHTRFIHPNIIDWPKVGSELLETQLPYLNWKADICTNVIDEIEDQWLALDIPTRYKHRARVEEMEVNGAYVAVAQPYYRNKFEVVIITVGFGFESTFGLSDQKTYWSNDDLHQHLTNEDETIFISGIGDGGLIDAMRLALLRFDHGKVVQDVMRHQPLLEIREALLATEDEARAIIQNVAIEQDTREARASEHIWNKYAELEVATRLPALQRRENIRKITLNSSLPTPMNINASIIDRVIIHGLVSRGTIAYERGGLVPFPENVFRHSVRLERSVEPDLSHVDRIVIRHGPLGALQSVVGEKRTQAYRSKSSVVDQVGQFLLRSSDPFRVPDTVLNAPTKLASRAQRILPKFIEWLRDEQISYANTSIQTDTSTGNPVFTVFADNDGLLKLKALPTLFERVPIIAQLDRSRPLAPFSAQHMPRMRPLVCGAAIEALSSGGTIGCFVNSPEGKPAFVSAGHVLGPLDGLKRPQEVLQPWQSVGPAREKNIIAHVTLVLPLRADGMNKFDIGYATLEPGIDFVQCCDPSHQAPAFHRIVEADVSLLGQSVVLAGPNKTVRGKVTGIAAAIESIGYDEGKFGFDGVIEISELDVGPEEVVGPSGSIVATNDGSVFGMIFAGRARNETTQTYYAFALAPALRELKCEFIPFSGGRES